MFLVWRHEALAVERRGGRERGTGGGTATTEPPNAAFVGSGYLGRSGLLRGGLAPTHQPLRRPVALPERLAPAW